MNLAYLNTVFIVGAAAVVSGGQQPAVRITSPVRDAVVSHGIRLEAALAPEVDVKSLTFSVNGRLVCTVDRPPYSCPWDPGNVIRGHHIRVVAVLPDGRRLADNVRTKDLGYTESVTTDAVLVRAIVTSGGRFVRGLTQKDFVILENGVQQRIDSMVSEDSSLDLVLAVDISGSMDHALEDVKAAVKQLLSKLRPIDAATLIGFNDNTFIAAEREKDPRTREEAVDLLTSWGGTSLYDATIKALELVGREWGRKGVVIFSDGDDKNSLASRETALSRVQASDAMVYTVGYGGGATVPRLRASLEEYAKATGGRAFFPKKADELNAIFDQIVAELSNQYVLSYAPLNMVHDGRWRDIGVRVTKGKYNIQARKGYQAKRLKLEKQP
jgi:Ca-activated chloride channel family protein